MGRLEGQRMLKTPAGIGGIIPTVKPIAGGIDGAPLNITAVSAVTTSAVNGNCVYMIASTPVHISMSTTGTAATVNDAWIPADIPFLFYCELTDRIAAVKRAGAADGNLWIHRCAQVV